MSTGSSLKERVINYHEDSLTPFSSKIVEMVALAAGVVAVKDQRGEIDVFAAAEIWTPADHDLKESCHNNPKLRERKLFVVPGLGAFNPEHKVTCFHSAKALAEKALTPKISNGYFNFHKEPVKIM